jgi:hypothetical protein
MIKWEIFHNHDEQIGYSFWSAYSEHKEINGLTFSELILDINKYMCQKYDEDTPWTITHE